MRVQIWGGWWQKLKQKAKMTRVYSGYDYHVHVYSQRVNIQLQGLDRCVLTVGEVSVPHCQNLYPSIGIISLDMNLHSRQKAL